MKPCTTTLSKNNTSIHCLLSCEYLKNKLLYKLFIFIIVVNEPLVVVLINHGARIVYTLSCWTVFVLN